MSKQVLQIEPQNELTFVGPFDVPVNSYMKLTNTTNRKMLFKIKTTAPKKYCVRPNSAILDAKKTLDITLCLQPSLDLNEKIKHKFMVQSCFVPDGPINIENLWKELQPDQLMETKLKCVFRTPGDENKSIEPSDSSINADLKSYDVQQLQEEEMHLRKENIQLKEEILRLKEKSNTELYFDKYQPPIRNETVSVFYVGLAIAMAILGMIMGKFIF